LAERKHKAEKAKTAAGAAPAPAAAAPPATGDKDEKKAATAPGAAAAAEEKSFWYDFNDMTVSPIPESKIANQYGGTRETAYMLYYRRRTVPPAPKTWVAPSSSAVLTAQERAKMDAEHAEYVKATDWIRSVWDDVSAPALPARLSGQIAEFNAALVGERVEYDNAINQIQIHFYKPERFNVRHAHATVSASHRSLHGWRAVPFWRRRV
jgi:hypothetical protein